MRKIEEGMIEAINRKENYRKDNTEVYIYKDRETSQIQIYLHNNPIAVIENNELRIFDKGYQTKTTKSRLNCILSHYNLPTIYAKKFQWYIGDEEWLGTKTFEINS